MQKSSKNWFQKILKSIRSDMRWLAPGIGVKRWLAVILAGITLLAVGFAILILDIYRNAPETWWLPIISFLSLRFMARPLRVVIFGLLGAGIIGWGLWGFNRALIEPLVKPGKHVLDTVSAYRRKERGPKIVVIGGGTGLSSLLRGLKLHTNKITAIVTVADDGGSSGELRKNIGILPPGDLRNCLSALSNDETMLTQMFQYRFGENAGLNGHSLGNLLITALTEITGSFEEAIAESGKVLAVRGQVLPATLHNVELVAEISIPENGSHIQVKGESEIPKVKGHVERVWLEPNNPLAFPPAIQAILSADLVLIGPGSLYTSILPNLLVPNLSEALLSSKALKFYVCNVATQPGETDGYSGMDHIHTIEKHLGTNIFDLVICNNNYPDTNSLPENLDWVKPDPSISESYNLYSTDLIDVEKPWRHDSNKLAEIILDLFYERTGPMISKEDLF